MPAIWWSIIGRAIHTPTLVIGAAQWDSSNRVGKNGGVEITADGPIVTVFRSRLLGQAAASGYEELAEAMESRARSMPGFLSFDRFASNDGERVSIIRFDSLENHDAWRDDPEHLAAQGRGRNDYYSQYSVSVCTELHRSEYSTTAHEDAPSA